MNGNVTRDATIPSHTIDLTFFSLSVSSDGACGDGGKNRLFRMSSHLNGDTVTCDCRKGQFRVGVRLKTSAFGQLSRQSEAGGMNIQ